MTPPRQRPDDVPSLDPADKPVTIGLGNGRLVVTDEAIRTETGLISAVRQAWRDSGLPLILYITGIL